MTKQLKVKIFLNSFLDKLLVNFFRKLIKNPRKKGSSKPNHTKSLLVETRCDASALAARYSQVSAIRSAMTERPVDPKETVIGENQLPTIPPDSCHRADMERCDASASSPDKNAYSSDDAVTANTVEPENGEPTNGVSVVGEGKNLTVASLCRSIDGSVAGVKQSSAYLISMNERAYYALKHVASWLS